MARIYNAVLDRFIDKSFSFWEKLGFHITPNHFYQPIPDTRTLKDDLWEKESELAGIDMNDNRQLDMLTLFSSRYKNEFEQFPENETDIPYQYYLNNGLFERIDGGILYTMIRHFKPDKILEIGSGNSTYLSAQAILKNKEVNSGYGCELVAVEPYPNETLKKGFPGLSRLVTSKAEDIPLSKFEQLSENDILFIDSSHVLKIGSDVGFEILEVLPRLNKGVIIHIHDIFLPKEYPRGWVLRDHVFVNEQYLLQAFLEFNEHFEVLWAGHYMRSKHHEKLKDVFGRYETDERWPCSFWMRKVK